MFDSQSPCRRFHSHQVSTTTIILPIQPAYHDVRQSHTTLASFIHPEKNGPQSSTRRQSSIHGSECLACQLNMHIVCETTYRSTLSRSAMEPNPDIPSCSSHARCVICFILYLLLSSMSTSLIMDGLSAFPLSRLSQKPAALLVGNCSSSSST